MGKQADLSLRQFLSFQQGRAEGQLGETGLCTSHVEAIKLLALSHLSPSFPAVTGLQLNFTPLKPFPKYLCSFEVLLPLIRSSAEIKSY